MEYDLPLIGRVWMVGLACVMSLSIFLAPMAYCWDAQRHAELKPYFSGRIRVLGIVAGLALPLFALLFAMGATIPGLGNSTWFGTCYCLWILYVITSSVLYGYYSRRA